ncbi:hypothetical protein GCM10010331_75230 [Streptomyces xanthochromogenes]|uniref:hypothetical protein n=1 Tax=Streptomyces xanthochromogenes TaxID=67384 RepID=UPI001672DFD8|nr:hypothetical protein [Streptomyces xanthochromogenes]GHB76275.1 hypothetical protein GCM10010331_75230 [Streptomyces xanthochromogenes]
MARRERRPRQHLPGIADLRIAADETTTALVVEALRREFSITDPEPYDSGYSYLRLDTGNTAADPDDD